MTALLLAAVVLTAPNGEGLQPDRAEGIHTPDLAVRVRDKAGKVQRSQARRQAFLRAIGRSKGAPGHVVDHIVPLACGGADIPGNMALQTTTEGKAKDRWELDCVKWQDGTYLRLLQKAIDEEKRGRR